jgi:uncharacterized protein YuzE
VFFGLKIINFGLKSEASRANIGFVSQSGDALYFRLDDDDIIESEEVEPGIILDFDENGRVIGIEILSLSTRFAPEKLRMLQFETV